MKYTSILNDKFSILLPDDFQDMDLKVASLKYPSPSRPSVIKTNEESSVDFMYNNLHQNVPQEQLSTLLQLIRINIMNVNSGVVFHEQGEIDEADNKIVWMEYENPTLDGQMYNIMFLVNVNNEVIQGMYNCNVQEKDKWKKIMLKSAKSIKCGGMD
ncbi:MAG: hypothetical protein MR531_04735 [Lachnospiraceae bacterium]|nr:hypothetical protein [Lachnospiraceae bacterium]